MSVPTPYLRAVEMIDERLPPFDCEMYQIHIPRALSAFEAPVVCGGGAVVPPPVEPAVTPPDEASATPADQAQKEARTAATILTSL
jgi:hypothetical protein